jgi:hypothetical protein
VSVRCRDVILVGRVIQKYMLCGLDIHLMQLSTPLMRIQLDYRPDPAFLRKQL